MPNPTQTDTLSVNDRFDIFEQLHRHQRCIDNDASRESVRKYEDLYWPEAKFIVHDLRDQTFEGLDGLKKMYDYAHSVFPMHQWRHSLGTFVIEGAGDQATVEWHWIVSWREGQKDTVSTGTYTDKFEKRNGQWKCLERVSDIDANWPAALFQTYTDKADLTFKAS